MYNHNMEILYNSDTTRISMEFKNTDNVYVSFNGLTGNCFGEDELIEVTDEFKSLAKHNTVFFIADKTMSWGNNIDWNKVKEVLQPFLEEKVVTSIGLSMGGSNAILATQFLKVNKVIAFNPQYTIYPEFYPETEYKEWADKIVDWKFKTIYSGFNLNTTYFLFWSDVHKPDTLFRGLFPNHADMFNFEEVYGHNLAGELKKEGKLTDLLKLCEGKNIVLIKEFIEDIKNHARNESTSVVRD